MKEPRHRRPPAFGPIPIFLGYALISAALDTWMPLATVPWLSAWHIGTVMVTLGATLALWCAWAFQQHRTTLDPEQAAQALVTTGPFRWSRNPFYVGIMAVLVGLAIDNTWTLVLALPTILAVQHFVIVPEEAQLERHFGEKYRQYRAAVRRWL